jgi:hypothetical protein
VLAAAFHSLKVRGPSSSLGGGTMENYWTNRIAQKEDCAKKAHKVAIELNFAASDADPELAKLLFEARNVLREARDLLRPAGT